MEKRITNINIINHFINSSNGKVYGTYQCKFKGDDKVFVRNDDVVYVLQHYIDRPELCIICDDVRDELLLAIGELTTL